MLFAARFFQLTNLDKKIRLKGRDQQELSYLFPGTYDEKAVTRHTKGIFKQFDKRTCKKHYISFL